MSRKPKANVNKTMEMKGGDQAKKKEAEELYKEV